MVTDAYKHLHQNNLVRSQYQFSRDWLKKNQTYFGFLKSSGSETTSAVVLNLWAECRRQTINWQKAANRNDGNNLSKAVFEQMAIKTGQLEKTVSDAVMERYLKTSPNYTQKKSRSAFKHKYYCEAELDLRGFTHIPPTIALSRSK